eukprot:TRINITY_DN2561_c1_g1_i1.p1 TRINITY_DN2561_c1_g1~~TRINITY_DN2561_c1_g1_i1.p1  ORF type:complete len:592 (+),score=78.62 TRINITY_DN2561_c1_g1_i1:1411-3186(+)
MEPKVEPEYNPIIEDGGILKKIITPGYGDDTPKKGQQVILLFECKLPDGSKVQSSSNPEQPTVFFADSEAVFKGLNLAALSMKRGEISHFKVKPDYSDSSFKDSELELKVEMLDFHDKWKHMIDLPEDERLEFASKIKAMGNEHFKAKRIKAAAYFYKQGTEYVDTLVSSDFSKTPAKVLELRKSLYQNLSIVSNNLGNWHGTIKYCSELIEKDPENAKARYLRGVALSKVGRFDDALEDLKLAQKQSPEDAKIVELVNEIIRFKKQQKETEKKKFQKIFQSESIYKEVAPKITKSLQKFPDYDPTNPKVFLEIQVGTRDPKILVFELIKTKVPRTVENFRVFCTGEKVHPYRPYSYKDSYFHRLIKNFMIQGGDIEKRDGTGGYSIYGDKFDDENFLLPHSQAGILSMANHGPNTNGCQFFITFKKTPWCDGKNVAFGRLIKGFEFLLGELQSVEVATEFSIPKLPIRIANCGEYKEDIAVPEMPPKKKKKTQEQFNTSPLIKFSTLMHECVVLKEQTFPNIYQQYKGRYLLQEYIKQKDNAPFFQSYLGHQGSSRQHSGATALYSPISDIFSHQLAIHFRKCLSHSRTY